MQRIRIPQTDLDVSVLCCGTGSFGTGIQGEATDRLIADYLEAGGNFFDTAHCYAFWVENGLGASEREVAASLRRLGALENAVVATKGGHSSGGDAYPRPEDFLNERLIQSDIEESLNRLEIERIDLYYLHRDDGRTPVGELIEMLNREVQRGRLRYLAASNWTVKRLAAANAYAAAKGLQGFVASQMQWSLAVPNWQATEEDPSTRTVTDAEITYHSETGIPLVAYSATASGYFATAEGGNSLYDNEQNRARRERAIALSAQLGCTPPQIAIAWLLNQKPPTIPLFGTTNRAHMAEILGAVNVSLTPEQVDWLTKG